MSDVECLVLGLLSQGYRYGHELDNAFKRRKMHLWSKLTRASLYNALTRIEQKGWAQVTVSKEGNFPEKKLYTLTEQGHAALREMIRDGLAANNLTELKVITYFSFFNALPTEEVIAQLQKRKAERLALLAELPLEETEDEPPNGELPPNEADFHFIRKHNIQLVRGYYELEIQWLDNVIADLALRQSHFAEDMAHSAKDV